MNYTLSFMGRAFNRFSPDQPSSGYNTLEGREFYSQSTSSFTVFFFFFFSILMEFLNLHVSFDVANEISEFP